MTFNRAATQELAIDCLRWKWAAAQDGDIDGIAHCGMSDSTAWAAVLCEADGFTSRAFASAATWASRAFPYGSMRAERTAGHPLMALLDAVQPGERVIGVYVEIAPEAAEWRAIAARLAGEVPVYCSFGAQPGGRALWEVNSAAVTGFGEVGEIDGDHAAVERYLQITRLEMIGHE